jgi:hypothetical protein
LIEIRAIFMADEATQVPNILARLQMSLAAMCRCVVLDTQNELAGIAQSVGD